jgi:hypothetical protein
MFGNEDSGEDVVKSELRSLDKKFKQRQLRARRNAIKDRYKALYGKEQ